MSFRTVTLIDLICDGDPDCDPWDGDGDPVFAAEQEAIDHATGQGWTFVDGVARCPDCTYRAATNNQPAHIEVSA